MHLHVKLVLGHPEIMKRGERAEGKGKERKREMIACVSSSHVIMPTTINL